MKNISLHLDAILSRVNAGKLTADDCDLAIERIEVMKSEVPEGLTTKGQEMKLPNWVALLDLVQEGIRFFITNLYDDEKKYKKPNLWVKLRFGGYAIVLLARIIILFVKG